MQQLTCRGVARASLLSSSSARVLILCGIGLVVWIPGCAIGQPYTHASGHAKKSIGV
jgi:hypothetical protein